MFLLFRSDQRAEYTSAKLMYIILFTVFPMVTYLTKRMSVCHAVCLSDEYQRLNYPADWAQTAYRCQVGPDDGFRLGHIPINICDVVNIMAL